MDKRYKAYNSKLEVWGGIECTINRVNDTYSDQLEYAGHYNRADDIDTIAQLGITAFRYPILWEKHQPAIDHEIDWSWASQQLNKIRSHNITPVVGLVHHGSGPAYTNLYDEQFPELLALYAKKVAQQFPWIEHYTPVNEPLTTARFSGLYGFWYPHKKDDRSYLRILINQLKGVVLSMQAIREINPAAKLIQTEDLAKVYSAPCLRYQTQFENERRWLTYDLLCSNIDSEHYLYRYLINNGVTEESLNFFLDNPCPPDILGANYYVTSERYLDHHIQDYPVAMQGGNGSRRYVDVEAVRVRLEEPCGPEVLLKELWNRFHLPIAITEAHLNCTPDEQMRWFKHIWDSCNAVKDEVNIIAVTAWSLLGAFGWDKLLTVPKGNYECGVFCIEKGELKKTPMVPFIKTLAKSGSYNHPHFQQPGWWLCDFRFYKQPKIA